MDQYLVCITLIASGYEAVGAGLKCTWVPWESFLRSAYSKSKDHVYDWHQVYQRAIQEEKGWLATPPHRMFVLSYPWDRREAFFCYATAKLCQLPWSAGLGNLDPGHKVFGGHFGTYPELVDLRLGKPVDEHQFGGKKAGEIYSREYEQGLVIVNPTRSPQKMSLSLGKERRYRDVFAAKDGVGMTFAVEIPAESGRVLIWK